MKFQDDISMPHTHTHTDKPKPICPPLFQSSGHKYNARFLVCRIIELCHDKTCFFHTVYPVTPNAGMFYQRGYKQ